MLIGDDFLKDEWCLCLATNISYITDDVTIVSMAIKIIAECVRDAGLPDLTDTKLKGGL